MARHWLWVVALLTSGCAMQSTGEPEDAAAQVGELPDISLRLDRMRAHEESNDLCAEGQDEIHGGITVHVPVPCVHEDIDRGDPSPDARERFLPGSTVERVMMQERTIARGALR